MRGLYLRYGHKGDCNVGVVAGNEDVVLVGYWLVLVGLEAVAGPYGTLWHLMTTPYDAMRAATSPWELLDYHMYNMRVRGSACHCVV